MSAEIVLLSSILALVLGFGFYSVKILHSIDKSLSLMNQWTRETLPLLLKPLLSKSKNPNSRLDELLEKMERGLLTLDEARELREILSKELQEAKEREDFAKSIALLLFLAFMAYAISKK